jgi:hypothetical protein
MGEQLDLFHEGIEKCPACGATITWNRSPDGSSVEILHPYDPKIGPPCAPFKAFCDQLQQRAVAFDLRTEWKRSAARIPPRAEHWREPCEPGEHVVDGTNPDRCLNCGTELGPLWGFPPKELT